MHESPTPPCLYLHLRLRTWHCIGEGAMTGKEPTCKDHPDAPHGFDRNGSHNAGRYVCECESWNPQSDHRLMEPIGYSTGPHTINMVTPDFIFHHQTEWARVTADNVVTHLDMDLCAKGPANQYTALAVAVWNAAIDAAVDRAGIAMLGSSVCESKNLERYLLELKK